MAGADYVVEKIGLDHLDAFLASEQNPVTAILFAGDRRTCIDHVLGLIEEDRDGSRLSVGVATFASRGEAGSGQPTLVGVYILPRLQGCGYGSDLITGVIGLAEDLELTPLRVDVLSARMMKVIKALPEHLQELLEVHDCGDMIDFLS